MEMTVFYIFLYLFLNKIFFVSANQKEKCVPSKEVIAELKSRYLVKIDNPNVEITYNLKNVLGSTSDECKDKLLINTSSIIFTGTVQSEKSKNDRSNQKLTFDTKPIVIQRLKKNVNSQMQNLCSVGTSENIELKIGLSVEMEATVIQLVEFCIKEFVCKQFDSLISNKLVKKKENKLFSFFHLLKESLGLTKKDKVKPKSVKASTPKPMENLPNCQSNPYSPQPTINAMIDFGIGQLTKNFFNGIVKIPDLKSNFSTKVLLWKITGDFHAVQGTFRNITVLRRHNDVVFSNEKLRFEMASTLGLQKALLKFENYSVRYGKLKISGRIAVDINQILVTSKVAIDFNQKPCKVYLQFFKVHDLGKINVVMTGIGALNHQAASVVSWIIKSKTFGAIKAGVDNNLSQLDCEKFRP